MKAGRSYVIRRCGEIPCARTDVPCEHASCADRSEHRAEHRRYREEAWNRHEAGDRAPGSAPGLCTSRFASRRAAASVRSMSWAWKLGLEPLDLVERLIGEWAEQAHRGRARPPRHDLREVDAGANCDDVERRTVERRTRPYRWLETDETGLGPSRPPPAYHRPRFRWKSSATGPWTRSPIKRRRLR